MKCLVAVDGSPASLQALQLALSLVPAADRLIVLLVVLDRVDTAYYLGMMPMNGPMVSWQGMALPEIEENLLKTGEAILQEAEEVCQKAGIPCRPRLERGSARNIICSVAKQETPDLLVLGSRGLGRIERLLLGSVSDYVVHHAPCPVLVVR